MNRKLKAGLKHKKWWWILPLSILAIVLVCGAYSYLPVSRDNMKRSVAVVQCDYYFVIADGHRMVAYFGGVKQDSTLDIFSTDRLNAIQHTYHAACWVNKLALLPSCKGRLIAAMDTHTADSLTVTVANHLDRILQKETDYLKSELKRLQFKKEELRYFLSIHDVMDEGYNMISQYATMVNHQCDSVTKLLKVLKQEKNHNMLRVKYVAKYKVLYMDDSLKQRVIPCVLTEGALLNNRYAALRTHNSETPNGTHALYFHLWPTMGVRVKSTVFAAGYTPDVLAGGYGGKRSVVLMPGTIMDKKGRLARTDIPTTVMSDGGAAFSANGFFVGLMQDGMVMNEKNYRVALHKMK